MPSYAGAEPMTASRIMIVEDEAAIREMVTFHLSRAGFDVIEAGDCQAAREQLANQSIDLATIDWLESTLLAQHNRFNMVMKLSVSLFEGFDRR